MADNASCHHLGCECDCTCDRRDFLLAMGASTGLVAVAAQPSTVGPTPAMPRQQKGARIRVAFLYPPSQTFAGNPDGWWSWPGNEFDAEGRQKRYLAELRRMEKKHGMTLVAPGDSIANAQDAQRLAAELKADPPDGLLLVMFYNRSLPQADALLAVAEELGLPAVFFIGLGVKHGAIGQYRRPGVYFIQSLDNFEAIEYGLRMINTRKLLTQRRLLSITEAPKIREGVEGFLGVNVRVLPFELYAEKFKAVTIDAKARELIASFTAHAKEIRGISKIALENAARAHLALTALLAEHQADGVTMNCLRRGMLKPCVSFSLLNDSLRPAACENDLPAAYTQLLGQLLTGRPGFQHNPCYETEANHYYASHCTCPTRLQGPDGPRSEYLLRRFAHTNEGSCAVQTFWHPGDPVTMVRYYPGKAPALDVYAGRIVVSHPMPPAAGCTTNVEIELTDRSDACMVKGHHNLLFCGDFARKFRLFAQLHKMKLAETGYAGPLG